MIYATKFENGKFGAIICSSSMKCKEEFCTFEEAEEYKNKLFYELKNMQISPEEI